MGMRCCWNCAGWSSSAAHMLLIRNFELDSVVGGPAPQHLLRRHHQDHHERTDLPSHVHIPLLLFLVLRIHHRWFVVVRVVKKIK